MLGGYQILDLRNIDLSRSTSEASISNAYVLKQLLHIRDHIQKTYDFSKPLHNQLKPLLIRYRDKKVGEKHEVALYGNIEVINTYYKFRIIANNEGEQLTINVEFEEKTDEYSNKYWDIKTAKVLLTSAEQTITNILAGGNVNNAKPVYCHPIYCSYTRSTDNDIVTFTCLIFNNDSEAFTKSSFLTWILAFFNTYSDASIMASGYKALYPVSRLKKHPSTSETLFALEVVSSNGQANNYYSIGVDELTSAIFTDGVNKIN